MVLHVFISFLGGVPLCIPYGWYSGTLLGGTTRGILGGFSGRVLSLLPNRVTIQWKLYRDIAFWACSGLGSMSRYNRIVS